MIVLSKVRNKSGVVTLQILIIITSIILLFTVLFQSLYKGYAYNYLSRNQKLKLEDSLAAYDTYLYSNYGLYGTRTLESTSKLTSTFLPIIQEEHIFESQSSLENIKSLDLQIQKFMTLRMPVNYLDQLLSKLEVIASSESTQHALDLTAVVDSALESLDNIYDQRLQLSLKANYFDPKEHYLLLEQINMKWMSFKNTFTTLSDKTDAALYLYNAVKKELDDFESMYVLLESPTQEESATLKALEQIEQAQKNTYDIMKFDLDACEHEGRLYIKEIQSLSEDLEALIKVHEKLEETLYKIDSQKVEIKQLVDVTLDQLKYIDGIQEVIDYLEVDLKKIDTNILWTESHESSINHINQNLSLLHQLTDQLNVNYGEALTRTVLIEYNDVVDTYQSFNTYDAMRNKTISDDDQSYYDDFQSESERNYDEPYSGEKVPEDFQSNQHEKPKFWSVTQLKNTLSSIYNDLVLNEYILSTFISLSEPSQTDFNFFDKYQRIHFFNRGEIEYILFGEDKESKNIKKTTGMMFAIRTVMNGIHVYTDKEKLALSESIGWSIGGWTGFGAPIITNTIRIGWSVGESFLDMKVLLKGDTLPFLKLSSEDWQLDIGLLSKSEPKSIPILEFSYHDYLRFMLMTVSHDTKLIRVQDILRLNLYKANYPYDLTTYHTDLSIYSYLKGKGLEFDSVMEQGYD